MSLSTILLVLFVLLCVGGVILSFVLRVERSPKIVASVSGTAGSVGQPKDGDPSASYAIWEDGQINLRRAVYPVEHTVRSYASTPLKASDIQCLVTVLRTGGELPSLPP